jgi:hypothetical protein
MVPRSEGQLESMLTNRLRVVPRKGERPVFRFTLDDLVRAVLARVMYLASRPLIYSSYRRDGGTGRP